MNLALVKTVETSYLSPENLNKLQLLRTVAAENRNTSEKAYEYVPTEQLVQSVGDHLRQAGYTFEVDIKLGAADKAKDGKKFKSTKHIAQFTLTNVKLFDKRGQGGGNGRVLIINSYNGECSLYLLAGAIRFCCANGLIAGEKEFFEKVQHRQGEKTTEALMRLNEKVDIACEYLKTKFSAVVDAMVAREVTYVEECRAIFALGIPNQAKLMAVQKLHPDNRNSMREHDRPLNLWSLYNVVNECLREAARHALSDFEHNASLMDEISDALKTKAA